MTIYLRINDVEESTTSVTVNKFQALATGADVKGPKVSYLARLELRRADDKMTLNAKEYKGSIGGNDSEDSYKVKFSGLQKGTKYQLFGLLLSRDLSKVIDERTREFTTQGSSSTPPVDPEKPKQLQFGDVSVAIIADKISQTQTVITASIANKVDVADDTLELFVEVRDKSGLSVATKGTPIKLTAKQTMQTHVLVKGLEAGTEYEARAFVTDTVNSMQNPISAVATAEFRTTPSTAPPGQDPGDSEPAGADWGGRIVAGAILAAGVVAAASKFGGKRKERKKVYA